MVVDPKVLEATVKNALKRFYERRLQSLNTLDLNGVLRRKNPYLFRAAGIVSASEMVNQLLTAHLSSSDETIFGNEFFEPICRSVLANGNVTAAAGSDFLLETDKTYEVIALKSGPNIFNSSQTQKQNDEFERIERSLRATLRSMQKQFVPIMGCGYGRVRAEPSAKRKFAKLAGQAFWERLTGDADFYLKISRFMYDEPQKHRVVLEEAWAKASNRLLASFTRDFCDEQGNIEWERLTAFNSGSPASKEDSDLPKRAAN